ARFPMQNRWFSDGRASALNLPSLTTGDSSLDPPLVPPDLPDPLAPLAIFHFPPLSSPVTGKLLHPHKLLPEGCPWIWRLLRTPLLKLLMSRWLTTATNLPPKHNPSPPIQQATATDNPTVNQTANAPSLAERIRAFEDKSLQRLAPITYSATGRPSVLILDEVFQRGEELHKDFLVCYFNGRAPSYSQIQSVLNHMWDKGNKQEIHNNPLNRSILVRIPSEYLRIKILEKSLWYIGDSMFHVAQWTSSLSYLAPSLKSIKIWAHLTGGLSLVAGLVGEPVEMNDFTKNLISLTLSHVKVEVNLTKELPRVVEFVRQNGEFAEVHVDYP
ncbi:unnamed protein product, partial [Thlaspi arvense]